jgi:Skp family chaperone for outer membrane proteins
MNILECGRIAENVKSVEEMYQNWKAWQKDLDIDLKILADEASQKGLFLWHDVTESHESNLYYWEDKNRNKTTNRMSLYDAIMAYGSNRIIWTGDDLTLEEMLLTIMDDNRQELVDWGKDVGREVVED